jgi:phage N-6-adenine-methyltransferase
MPRPMKLTKSATVEWSTPQRLFRELNEEFKFTVDAAASVENAKCPMFYTASDSGLEHDWSGQRVWLNPPYGTRDLEMWIRKAYESSKQGATVVCLVPVKCEQGWWHNYAIKAEIRWIRGRLHFGNAEDTAKFPVCILVFKAVANGN